MMKDKKVINFTDVVDMDTPHAIKKHFSPKSTSHKCKRSELIQDAQNAIGVGTIPNSS
jgi:hypothetical protein